MKKIIFLVILIIPLVGCSSSEKNKDTLNIAVTIQPEIGFVQAVIGDRGTVTAVIPPGNSPANYQPSPQELATISDADVYFSIGVPAEQNILPKIISNKTDIISLLEAVEVEYPLRHMEEHEHDTHDESKDNHEDLHEGVDPHTWMSPKRVIVMVHKIADTLSELDPKNKERYTSNAKAYITQLEALDQQIIDTLADSNLEGFIIYHPSMGYFADDYHLDMHVIEEGGKEATINSMTHIIDLAREKGIDTIFYQEEFDSKQAKVIASEIDGHAIPLDILSKDYIDNMKKLLNLLLSI